jgi:ATP-binding cassette subfamily C protein
MNLIEALKKLSDILPRSDRWKFAALFLLMIFGTLLEVIGIGMIPVFISAVADPGLVLNNHYLGPVAAFIGIHTGKQLLLDGGIGLIVIFLLKGVYTIWLNYVQSKFVYNRYSLIARHLFESYLSAPYTFHLNRNTAELIRNVTKEARYISNNVMMSFMKVITNSVMIAGIFILLLVSEPYITLVTFLIIGGAGGLILKLLRKNLRQYGKTASLERKRMIQGISEGLGGFKDITVMNRQKMFIDRLKKYIKNLTDAQIFRGVASSAGKPVIELVSVVAMLFIAFALIWEGRAMTSVIPILALFGAATIRLMPAVNNVITRIVTLRYYTYAIDPVHKDMMEMKGYNKRRKKESHITEKLSFNDAINLNDTWYKYPDTESYILKGIDLTIPKKTSVGFVGPTGVGKSTIVDIILGLLIPDKGQVLVDGVDIQTQKRAWQNNVGYIPQSIYLSDDTVRNNIAFGIPELLIDEKKVQAAMEAAQLDELVNRLPNGLETLVGEGGIRLSGGQRQRICIARALYDNPEVLIMDEATSSLDNVTERKVMAALEALKGERTIIMIAHRLTTVKKCDQLYLMEDGRIARQGTYAELVQTRHQFREMAVEQG